MPSQSTATLPQSGLVTAIKEMAVGAILFGGVGLIVSKVFGWTDNKQLIAIGSFILIGLLLPLFVWRRLIRFFDGLGPGYMRRHTGIAHTYDNLHECKNDMEADFRRAKRISLFLQVGRWELGSGEPSYFSVLVREKEIGSQIRILRASDKSPFLSKERADNLGYKYEHWVESMRRLSEEIDLLRDSKAKIEDRQHDEPYLWRIFIFDDVAYVSPYLYLHENHKKAIVYKLEDGEDSLYAVFKKYFDYVWMKYDPTGPTDPNQCWANWE